MLRLKEVGNVIQVNDLGVDGKDVLLHCVVTGTEGDECSPFISAYTKNGEDFRLCIVREASIVEDYEFTPLVRDIIIDRAKRKLTDK